MYQQQYAAPAAATTAVSVKLMRNVFMAGVIPLMALLYRRGQSSAAAVKAIEAWMEANEAGPSAGYSYIPISGAPPVAASRRVDDILATRAG